jgi:hypothetical protein
MATNFRIRKGGSIMIEDASGNMRSLVGPRYLTEQEVEALQSRQTVKGHTALEDHIREGFVEIDGVSNVENYRYGGLIVPGVHSATHRPLVNDSSTNPGEATPESLLVRTSGDNSVESRSSLPAPERAAPLVVSTSTGPFSIDPSLLAKVPLDDLNTRIIDLLPADERREFEPYETAAEAIAHLSRDWKKPE